MAAPHVAGVAARLSVLGLTPAEIRQRIIDVSTKGELSKRHGNSVSTKSNENGAAQLGA